VLTLQELNARHQETFGKRLTYADNQALITFANEKSKELDRQLTLTEAYELKHKDDLQKVWVDKKTEEITKDVTTRLNVPVPGGSGMPERGPLQIRMEQIQGKDLLPGNDSLAEAKAKAAAALRAEGKF
jgi:hypothetical protein